jgi:predicted phage tail protein
LTVKATDNQGAVTTSSAVNITVNANTPTAPTNLTATAVSRSQINLTWTDNSSNETGFKIERSTNGTSFTQIATVGAGVTSYASTGLQKNRTYYYRVRATNGAGDSAYSNVASARTFR